MYNNAQYTPPVNNLLQPDIYNRLDAEAIERTRVINTQLDQRLRVQQRLITKYRLAAERFHRREKDRVKSELSRINLRLPTISRIPDFRNKFLYGTRPRATDLDVEDVSQSLPEMRLRKIRGVPQERPNLPFCERYFMHHLPTKKKFYRDPTPPLPLYLESEGGGGGGGGDGGVAGEGADGTIQVEAGEVSLRLGEGDARGGGAAGEEGTLVTASAAEASNTLTLHSVDPGVTANDVIKADSHDVQVADSAHVTPERREPSRTGDASPVINEQQKLNGNRQTSSRRRNDDLSEKDSAVRADHRSRPHSINGRRSPRKSSSYAPSDAGSLPPLHMQNKKLARSSPQLYHG